MKHASGIYLIANAKTGKVYIGQAQDLHVRWCNHRSALKRADHKNLHLQAAWNKYGEKSFKFLVLEYCPIEKLNEREQHYLEIYFKKGICYNLSQDSQLPMRGRKHTPETRQKISNSHLGKPFTEEHKRKLSIAAKKRGNNRPVQSASTEPKEKTPRKGRKLSQEHINKLREVNKGNKYTLGKHQSEATILKRSLAMRGKNRASPSEETRRKISQSLKGRKKPPYSEETKRKLSEAAKEQWRRKREAMES